MPAARLAIERLVVFSRYNAQHALVDSDVGKGAANPNPLARISGTPTGTVNTADVLVLKVSGASPTAIDVADVSGDRIEMEDVAGATSSNPLGLGSNEVAYLVYWAEEEERDRLRRDRSFAGPSGSCNCGLDRDDSHLGRVRT